MLHWYWDQLWLDCMSCDLSCDLFCCCRIMDPDLASIQPLSVCLDAIRLLVHRVRGIRRFKKGNNWPPSTQ